MHQKERMLREIRIIEATKNNIMGPAGKFGIIAKWLGTSILKHSGGLFDINYLEQYSLNDEEKMPTVEDNLISKEGWVFDGLSRGMHIEIKYTHYDKKLVVDYKGYRVYTEMAGELESYAPFPDWENMIDKLYNQAIKKKKEYEIVEKEIEQKTFMQDARDYLQELRLKWGI